MRINVLSEGQYTGHDLHDDRFGQLRETPLALARRARNLNGIFLSYQRQCSRLQLSITTETNALARGFQVSVSSTVWTMIAVKPTGSTYIANVNHVASPDRDATQRKICTYRQASHR